MGTIIVKEASALQQTTCAQDAATLLEVNRSRQSITMLYLAFAALAFLAVASSAALHICSGRARWRACLWVSTIMLAGLALFPTALALFFVPSLLLALLASAASFGNRHAAAS